MNARTLPIPSRRTVSALAVDALLVILWGGLIAVSRTTFDLSLGIPGHSGILWMALLVSGRLIVKRDGAALAMGLSTALWGVPLGMGNSLMYNLGLYMLVGGALDLLVRIPGIRLDSLFWAPVCGALAHLTKFGFITAYAMSLGLYRRFWETGLAVSAGYHLLFGALGGLAAVTVFGIIQWRRSGRRKTDRAEIDETSS